MEECILVTGGAGFIGCAVSHGLQEFGLHVVAVDNLLPQVHPQQTRPFALPAFVDLRVADITERSFWVAFLEEYHPRILVHFAAETGTGQSLTASARHARVNVVGTAEMLDAMAERGIVPEHILLSSSRAVYGEGAWQENDFVFYPRGRTQSDLTRGRWNFSGPNGNRALPLPHRAATTFSMPTSVYGATKLTQEHILSSWGSAMGAALTILRFQNVYGPGQSPFNAYTGIINIFHRVARRRGIIDVYEDGAIGRDFVYIDDVVDACLAALAKPPKSSRTLDVGFGKVTTILDVARIIATMHGAPTPEISGKFRPGDVRWAVSDPQDLDAELGVKAKVEFEVGCEIVGKWLVDNGFA